MNTYYLHIFDPSPGASIYRSMLCCTWRRTTQKKVPLAVLGTGDQRDWMVMDPTFFDGKNGVKSLIYSDLLHIGETWQYYGDILLESSGYLQ
jgi:hypothetical protein